MLEINNITFRYGGSHQLVFDNFSLSMSPNRIYGLLGKNGTGKSTLLYLMSGLLLPRKGDVKVDGVEMGERRPESLREIYIVPEEFEMPSMSLSRYVKLNEKFYPRFSREVLQKCMKEFELPEELHLKALSMGQKKKVLMSFALASGTRLLLMDEPTNGLDIPSKTLFRRVVAENMTEDRTLIISTHQVHDVESLLDHVIIIDHSHILLDAEMSDLSEKYTFEYRMPSEMNTDVIYAEPTLQGNAVIVKRTDKQETPVSLELLFNAVISGALKEERV